MNANSTVRKTRGSPRPRRPDHHRDLRTRLTEAKRKALEATYTEIVTDELPEWNHDSGLLTWLASL